MTIRTVLIGVGGWARMGLAPAIASVPELELVACADADLEAARQFAAVHRRIPAYGSIEALLESERDLGLVVIATPDHLHAPMTLAALEAGASVFCEKPLANEAGAAETVAARAGERPCTVGFSFRYSLALQALKREIASGALGEPWLIELNEHNPQFHPKFGKPLNWKGDPAAARAGALFEYGSHVVDLAQWLIGPIRRVSTAFSKVVPGARLDDIATLQLEFDGPTIGTLVASWVLAGSFPGIRVCVTGSEAVGEAQLNRPLPGGEMYRRVAWSGEAGAPAELRPGGEVTYGHVQRHMADLAAIIAGDPPVYAATLPTLVDGARVQRVLDAALQATEQWVRIDAKESGIPNQK